MPARARRTGGAFWRRIAERFDVRGFAHVNVEAGLAGTAAILGLVVSGQGNEIDAASQNRPQSGGPPHSRSAVAGRCPRWQRGPAGQGFSHSFRSVLGRIDPVAVHFQDQPERLPTVGIIFNEENWLLVHGMTPRTGRNWPTVREYTVGPLWIRPAVGITVGPTKLLDVFQVPASSAAGNPAGFPARITSGRFPHLRAAVSAAGLSSSPLH